MLIHDLEPGSDEWKAWRAEHDCASEASVMMGASKHTKRNELLHMKVTGTKQEFSEFLQSRVLDNGHRVEALARPIIEEYLSEDLSPLVTSDDDDVLGASLDGITWDYAITWECKQWNNAKAELVRQGIVPEEDRWQVVQQLVVTKAQRCLYTVTDGTRENTVSCFYSLQKNDERDLRAGWAQFHEDEATYTPTEKVKAAVADEVPSLPAIVYTLDKTSLALTSNIDMVSARADVAIRQAGLPLRTDQDFANGEALHKEMQAAEKRLAQVCEDALNEIADVAAFVNSVRELSERIRQSRIKLGNGVKTGKEQIKQTHLKDALAELDAHVAKLNERLGRDYMPVVEADFIGAMKNKRTLDSLKNALDTELAQAKIRANEIADAIQINVNLFRDRAQQHRSLFPDVNQLVLKDSDAVEAIITARISEHEKERQAEIEAAQQRARDAEKARIEAEQAEQARQAAEAAKPEPEPAPVPVEAPSQNNAPPATRAAQAAEPIEADVCDMTFHIESKMTLIAAVAGGRVSPDVLDINMDVLAELVKARATLPGVRVSKAAP